MTRQERIDHWIAAGWTDAPHFVRVECDYEADGLWSEMGGTFTASDLNISPDLLSSLAAWQAIFEQIQPEDEDDFVASATYVATATFLARRLKSQLPKCIVVAIDRRIRSDLSVGERVPWPGEGATEEERGEPYAKWKVAFLSGKFRL